MSATRVANSETTIFTVVNTLAAQYNAVGLSQGAPDFDTPRWVLDIIKEAFDAGRNQYAPLSGVPEFRKAISDIYRTKYGLSFDPNTQITVTSGATEAIFDSVMALCDPGDRVLVFSPFYENYGADAILSGAEPIYIPLVPPDYSFDPDLIEQGFRIGAKAIVICNPSNPCGKVFTREELLLIGDLAKRYDAYIVTDEVYEHMVYAPSIHTPMAGLPGMAERTITCNSLSKTFSITGWRLGYLIGPEKVVEAARKVHDFLTVGAPSPLQEAAVTGLGFGEEYYRSLNALYRQKRDYFLAGLDRLGLKHNIPQGTYFVLVEISDFLRLPQFQGWSDLEFCEWMIREVGVAAVPGSSFFREPVNNLIRLHFARSQETLDEVFRRLEKLSILLQESK